MNSPAHNTDLQNRTFFVPIFHSDFTGKERDEETGYGYFGARYMDHDLITMWLSVDPMVDKYPSISPYAYCAWNPMTLVDPDGKELSPNPYMIFNGNTHTLQIWDDNNTPDNFSDDLFLGQFNAGNNVSPRDNPAGNWEDGIYPMEDTQETHKHTDEGGNPITEVRGGQKIPVDSELGAYGVLGIFRAKKFTQEDGVQREGMGVHSGRGFTDANVDKSYTRGCIRTTPEAMDAIVGAIKEFGALTNIIVQCNRTSSKSPQTNTIFPGHGLPHYVLNEINIIETTK